MASLANTDLQPPYIAPTPAPRSGLAIRPLSPNGKGRGKRAGALSFDPPTLEVWEAIIDAFRIHPGHVVNAARRAGNGVTPAYAKYAWENGWWNVEGCEKMIPGRDVIAAELATARAIVVRQPDSSPETIGAAKAAAKDTVALAVEDIGAIRAAETKTLRIAQSVTQAALASSTAIKKIMPALTQRIADAIMKEKDRMQAKDLLRLLRQYTEIEHLMVTQAKTVAEMRRHLFGEADLTISHEHSLSGDFVSEEAALAELRESARLMERYRGSNIVDVDVPPSSDDDLMDPELGADSDGYEYESEDDDLEEDVGGTEYSASRAGEDGESEFDPFEADSDDDDGIDEGAGYVRRRVSPQNHRR